MQWSSLNCSPRVIAVPVFTTKTWCLCCYRSPVLARLPPVYLCGGSQVIVERYTTRCSSCLVLHLCRSLMGLGFVAPDAAGLIPKNWESYRKMSQKCEGAAILVSKVFSNHTEIWQAFRQHRCRSTCHISKLCGNLKPNFTGLRLGGYFVAASVC